MKTLDLSGQIVLYNLVIGILLMLASEKVSVYVASIVQGRSEGIARLTRISTFTFGACIATLSGAIYVLFHILRLGV